MGDRKRATALIAVVLAIFLGAGVAASAPADAAQRPVVEEAVEAAIASDGSAPVIVRMRAQADLSTLVENVSSVTLGAVDEVQQLVGTLSPGLGGVLDDVERTADPEAVVDLLQGVARSAGGVTDVLRSAEAAGDAEDVRQFWIFNGFSATVDGDALEQIASRADVATVTLDDTLELAEPAEPVHAPTSTELAYPLDRLSPLAGLGLLGGHRYSGVAWGVEHVRAPKVWEDHDTQGQGVVVGVMDSGADASHPALAGSWRGRGGDVAASWYAATGEPYSQPTDVRGHGTHVLGSIVGSADGYTTGVAPGVEWIAAKIFRDSGYTTESVIHAGFEWMLAPGGDPSKAPDVVNGSWGTNDSNALEFWADVEALVAAGVVPVFAVGNHGPAPGSLASPASFPHSIAVGATGPYDRVGYFSGRGPVWWDGERYTKPDVTAPGVRIRSTWASRLGGGYRLMTGTSMAAPHVTGTIALMLAVNPDLTLDDVRAALESSARSAGTRGVSENAYGAGVVDAPAAVERAANDS